MAFGSDFNNEAVSHGGNLRLLKFQPHFHPPIMADAEGISLEETNKIRISLGLKPLTDDKAPANKHEATAEENYANRKEQERKEKERR